MSKTKKQHYVPQFLLRNFAIGRKGKAKLWVLDKRSSSVFHSSVRDVAHENLFYEYHGGGGNYEFENLMEKVDSKGSAIISNIIERNRLPESIEHRIWLSYYLAAQMLRTPATRNDMENFRQIIIQKWGKDIRLNDDPRTIGEYGPKDAKASSLHSLQDVPTFAKILQTKVWCLCEAPSSYVISDSPITRHNMIDRGHRGNLGLRNEGIEVYMPLSPRLAIHLICPKIATAALLTPELTAVYSRDLVDKTPVRLKPENIEFINSLQVIWAERFVYAKEREHLEMPLDMLRTNPELKDGPGVRQTPLDA